MDCPLVSVIIPVYNVEKYLNKCVDSVIGQTYRNLEILLVDDGSTDGSGAICDEYAARDERVRVIHKENGGLSSARNAALDVCKGEYVAFVDSDDFVSLYFIELYYRAIVQFDGDIAAVQNEAFFLEGREDEAQLVSTAQARSIEQIDPHEAIRLMLYQNIPTGAPWKFYKRSIFDDIRFPVGWLYEDAATIHRLFMKANKMVLLDADIYAYRHRPNSIVRMSFKPDKLIAAKIGQQIVEDVSAYDPGLRAAACCRALAMNYNVYLQVPWEDKQSRDILWNEIKTYRMTVLRDHDKAMRKKNRLGALVSFAGQRASWLIGRAYTAK